MSKILIKSSKIFMKRRTVLLATIGLFFAVYLCAGTPFGNQGLSWSLKNGVLTISKTGTGTGEMPNYTFGDQTPWLSQKDAVIQLVIGDGVTCIGNYAFEKYTSLSSITFSETVKHIGAYAFSNCAGLTSVTLPEGLESIGYKSFHYCTGLQSVTIPSSVTIIFHEDFAGCKNLKEVYVNALIPPVCKEYVFAGIPSDCILYVPGSSRPAYEQADTWKDFDIFTDETSVEQITATSIQIYPNPATDGFTINGITNEKTKLTLTNMNGMIVLSQTISIDEYISVSSLPAGVYLLKIDTPNGSVVEKLIKK